MHKHNRGISALLVLACVLLVALMSGCTPIGQAIQLDPGEIGAVCYRANANSVNPFVDARGVGSGIEINTGDPSAVVTPEQLAAVAEALGCRG